MRDYTFADLWRCYPHHKARSKKAVSEAIFKAVINGGRSTKVDGLSLFLQAKPDEIVRAAKAYHMIFIKARTPADGIDLQYSAALNVWLNQGRFLDLEDEDRDSLAAQYDAYKEGRTNGGLRLVK